MEERVLSFERDNDLPGPLIPAVYFDYLRRKDPAQLPRVFEHNRHDILSVAALAGWMGIALAQAPGGDAHPEDLVGLGRLWEPADRERSAACYRMAIEAGLTSPAREGVLSRLAREEKRMARWAESRALWEAAARSGGGFDSPRGSRWRRSTSTGAATLALRGPSSRKHWPSPGSTGPPSGSWPASTIAWGA